MNHNKIQWIIILLGSITFNSCVSEIWIGKNQEIYSLKTTNPVQDSIVILKPKGSVTIKVKNDFLLISAKGELHLDTVNTKASKYGKVVDPFRTSINKGDFYYPDIELTKSSLQYTEFNSSLRALNITFKNYFKVRDAIPPTVQDSFPSTWSSGFNPAIAYGLSFSHNWYNSAKEKRTLEASLGGFYGFGITDINNKTTRNPTYNHSKKNLIGSRGFFINLGYQKWDIGYTYGWDKAFGANGDQWIYQNQPFHGILIGYDLVKIQKSD